jgi:hypothetical protein
MIIDGYSAAFRLCCGPFLSMGGPPPTGVICRTLSCLLPEETDRVRHVLGRLFRLSISPSAPDRFIAYCRIAPHIGETSVVIDMAGSLPEHLHEHGSADALRQILTDTLDDSALSDEDRFWAADTLTFWDIQRGDEAGRIYSDMVLLEQRLAPCPTTVVRGKRWP